MRRRLMGSTFLGSKLFLRHPGDDDTIIPGAEDKSGGGGTPKKDDVTPPPVDDDDSDPSIDSLFKKQGDDDDIQSGDDPDDFNTGDSDVDDTAIDQEFETKATALRGTIEGLLTGFVVKESDIPDDLGFSDKAKAAEFMTSLQQRAVKQSMQVMNPVISHVMNLAVAKINNRLKSEVKTNGAKSVAKSEFDKLGFTEQADRSTALMFYKRGLSADLTPAKAAAATKKAMSLLGKHPKAAKASGGQPGKTTLEGVDALDSFF